MEAKTLNQTRVEAAKPAPSKSMAEPLVGKRAGAFPVQMPCELNEALLRSVEAGNKNGAERLLKAGASPDSKCSLVRSALKEAVLTGKEDIAELLIAGGAEANAGHADENALLRWAATSGKTKIVKLLIDAGAEVNPKPGMTPALIHASMNGQTEIVKLLLDAGAEVNARDKHGWTALTWADGGNHRETVELLKGRGGAA